MESGINQEFSTYGITTRHYGLLLVVNENDGITQKEAGELLRTDRTTMVKLVDYLESLDYIKREQKPNDRRAYVLKLTERSKSILKKAMQILRSCERQVLDNLQPLQVEKFNEMQKIINQKEKKS